MQHKTIQTVGAIFLLIIFGYKVQKSNRQKYAEKLTLRNANEIPNSKVCKIVTCNWALVEILHRINLSLQHSKPFFPKKTV